MITVMANLSGELLFYMYFNVWIKLYWADSWQYVSVWSIRPCLYFANILLLDLILDTLTNHDIKSWLGSNTIASDLNEMSQHVHSEYLTK